MRDLLRDGWVEALADDAARTANDITNSIAELIARRIKTLGRLSLTDAQKLTNAYAYLGADLAKIEALVAEKAEMGRQEVHRAIKRAADAVDSYAADLYLARGMAPVKWAEDETLQQFYEAAVRQTDGLFSNLSNTLAYKLPRPGYADLRQTYTAAIDRAIYEVRSGTTPYNVAMRRTVDDLATKVRIITINGRPTPALQWRTGYVRRLDSHVRQNLIDGVRQMNQQLITYHGEKFGADGVELSAHAISAPDHAPLQGKQYSKADFEAMQSERPFTDVTGKQYDPIERPIGEWNCRHFAFPILLGISKPAYTDAQLARFEKQSAAKYRATQQMRAMETELRALKGQRLAESAAGMDDYAARTQYKINTLSQQYYQFCRNTGLEPQMERARVKGYYPISAKGAET